MLSYKLIKRKYKLTDSNIADFFGYKSRISFFTSPLKDFLVKHIERTYDRYMAEENGGVKGAADYIKDISFPASSTENRRKAYKAGLFEFVDTVNFQQRKGKFIDPKAGPRAKMRKYTGKRNNK